MIGRGAWTISSQLAIVLGIAASATAAETYCVSCSGPQASYLCEVSVPEGVVASQSPQLYCAYKLAGEGHHASCASRRADASSCQGEPRKLAYEGPSLAAPATIPSDASSPADPEPPADALTPQSVTEDTAAEPAVDPVAAPATVAPAGDDVVKDGSRVGEEEVAARAEDAERSTGEKIAGAAKTAFNCLATFFKECKE